MLGHVTKRFSALTKAAICIDIGVSGTHFGWWWEFCRVRVDKGVYNINLADETYYWDMAFVGG